MLIGAWKSDVVGKFGASYDSSNFGLQALHRTAGFVDRFDVGWVHRTLGYKKASTAALDITF